MTHLTYADGHLHVRFPGWEAAMVGRDTFTAPTASIRSARTTEGWSSEILGYRSGFVVSGYRKLGVFTHPSGTRRLVSMKRGLPLLRVALVREIAEFDELLVSSPDAVALGEALSAAVTR